MLAYRKHRHGIFSSKKKLCKRLYSVLACDINHKILPGYSQILAKNYKEKFLKTFLLYVFTKYYKVLKFAQIWDG